jgi:hypothetical protein
MKTRTAIAGAAVLVFLVLVLSQSRVYWIVPAWLIVVPICLAVGYVVWRIKK